jgi:hypothetical protein
MTHKVPHCLSIRCLLHPKTLLNSGSPTGKCEFLDFLLGQWPMWAELLGARQCSRLGHVRINVKCIRPWGSERGSIALFDAQLVLHGLRITLGIAALPPAHTKVREEHVKRSISCKRGVRRNRRRADAPPSFGVTSWFCPALPFLWDQTIHFVSGLGKFVMAGETGSANVSATASHSSGEGTLRRRMSSFFSICNRVRLSYL